MKELESEEVTIIFKNNLGKEVIARATEGSEGLYRISFDFGEKGTKSIDGTILGSILSKFMSSYTEKNQGGSIHGFSDN